MSGPDRVRGIVRSLSPVAGVLLFSVGLVQLPRDVSLSNVHEQNFLKTCMADRFLPYSNRDPAQPGFEQIVAQAVAASIGVPLQINWGPAWDLLPAALRRQQCDVVIGAGFVSPDMLSWINPSQAYYSTGDVLVRRTGDQRIQGLSVLQHEVIGVEAGSGAETLLRERGITSQALRDQDSVLRQVSSGTVDAGYVEMLSAAWQLREHPELGVELLPGQTPDPQWNAVIMVRAQDETLRQAVKRALQQALDSGKIADVFATYGLPYLAPLPDPRDEVLS